MRGLSISLDIIKILVSRTTKPLFYSAKYVYGFVLVAKWRWSTHCHIFSILQDGAGGRDQTQAEKKIGGTVLSSSHYPFYFGINVHTLIADELYLLIAGV